MNRTRVERLKEKIKEKEKSIVNDQIILANAKLRIEVYQTEIEKIQEELKQEMMK